MPASGREESEPRRAEIAGAEFAWSEAGHAREARPPLLLVHGFTGHRDDFVGVLPALARQRRAIAPDLRGHGDFNAKTGASEFSFEQLVSDLIALLDHLGIDRCDLLGHSMGGMLAQRLVLAHPHRVRRLILMCTAPEVPATLSREGFERAVGIAEARGMETLQTLMEAAGRRDGSATIAGWADRYWPHHRRRLLAMTPESFREIGRVFFASSSLVDRLGKIDAPTLVLVGEHDADFLPGAELFERHLPRVKRITLADAEHHPQQENPKAWLAAVEAHLDGD